jgi:hypothetical protein
MRYECIATTTADLEEAVKHGTQMLPHAKKLYVKVEPFADKRKQQQNRRYWAMLTEIEHKLTIEGQQYGTGTWHEYFKGTFIGWEEKQMPDGRVFAQPISSTDLTVKEFAAYMERVENWATSLGVVFEELPEVG